MLANPFKDMGSFVGGTSYVVLEADLAVINNMIDNTENFDAFDADPTLGDLYEQRNAIRARLDRLNNRANHLMIDGLTI